MEVLILGWYVLVQTDSPFLLALIGVARFGGTLLTPFIGTVADRLPRKGMLVSLRALLTTFAVILMALAWAEVLQPWQAFVAATLTGLIRPADMMLRQSLTADIVPRETLLNAMAFSRTTLDSARIVGALAGATLMATLGIGAAYLGVALFYLASTAASLRIRVQPISACGYAEHIRPHAMADLADGLRYVLTAPRIQLLLALAFVVNLSGLCITGGLLPLMARDVYGMSEIGLGFLVATFAGGALVGSLVIATVMRTIRGEQLMLTSVVVWHVLMVAFALNTQPGIGVGLLAGIGLLSSFAMVPMSSVLLAVTQAQYRGRIMGLRQLAVVGLPLGLLAAGALVEPFGVGPTLAGIACVGVLFGVVLLAGWKRWS